MTSVRDGRAATIADRDLNGASVHRPRHLQSLSGQRIRMQDRVTEQLADDEHGIPDSAVEDSGGPEII